MTRAATRPGRLRRFALALLALAAAPAAAQTVKTPQAYATAPADHLLVTPNGVDLRSGRFNYRQTDLSIGGEGDSGLQLIRVARGGVWGHVEPFANFTHNLDIMIAEKRVHITGGNYDHGSGSDYRMIVRFGTRSETFDGSASGPWFEQISKTAGARLTYSGGAASGPAVYTYQTADGTVATFRPLGNGDCSDRLRCAYVSRIDLPDGTRLSFDYENPGPGVPNMTRLRAVTSSRGYALLLEYGGGGASWNQVSKACLINLAEQAMPAGNVCPANAAASSAYTYAGGRLASSTDAGGDVSTYRHGQAGGGHHSIGFVKPGQDSPWLTNSYALFADEDGVRELVVRQALAGGQSWDVFLQDGATETENQVRQLAGGDIVDAEGRRIVVRYGFPRMPKTLVPGYNPEAPENFPGEGPHDGGAPPVYQITAGPVAVTDALGRTTRYDYCDPTIAASLPASETHRCVATPLRSYTDPEGIRTELTYDAFNNVTQVKRVATTRDGQAPLDPLVVSATYACWTAQGVHTPKSCTRPATATDAKGNVTTWAYAPQHGGVLTETGPAVDPGSGSGAGSVTPQKRYAYGQRYARLWNGEPGGPEIWLLASMSQCRTGNPHPGGTGCALGSGDEMITTYDYGPETGANNLHLRGQAVTADGVTLRTCYGYDGLGRRISETGPAGTVGLTACPAGPPTAALPHTASTRYDSDGRVTGTIAPDPDGSGPLAFAAVRNSYDPAGRLVKVEHGQLAAWHSESTAPSAWPGFTVFRTIDTRYDALDRKVREAVIGSDGVTASVTEHSYDLAGRPRCTAVRMNPDVWTTPLADPCVPGPAHADHGEDRISRSVHDDAGQLVEAWDGVGTALQRREAAWTYDGNGRKTSLTDARGFRAEMRHDGHGRQSRWVFPSATTAATVNEGDYEEYRYDPNGNRTELRKRDGVTLAYAYDALDRMTRKDVPASASGAPGYSVFYKYDLRGLQTEAWFGSPAGAGISNSYDGFGRQATTTTTMDGYARTLTFEYDRAGNRTAIHGNWGYYAGFTYDALGRMTSVRDGGGTQVRLGYDTAGRRSTLDTGPNAATAATSYHYDPVGRLKTLAHDLAGPGSDQTLGFAYNPASQIVTRSSSNDAYNWTPPAVDHSYRSNGLNQYVEVGPNPYAYDSNGNLTSDGITTFIYDAENRLVSATGPGNNVILSYDPLGRLWQVWGATGKTQFVYDGDDRIFEFDGFTNGALRAYAHGPGPDEPLILYEAGAGRRFYQADHQGSIAALVDDAGVAVATNAYDAWGMPRPGNYGRFGYTGQAWVPELGLNYYKARFYSPPLGRFLQTDPIGYEGGINLYAYVENDPVNGSDPTGQACPRDEGWCGFVRDFFVGDIEDAVANPTPVTIGTAIVTTVFKPAKVLDKVRDGVQALRKAERLAENVAKGARGEAATAARLGDDVAGRRVSFRNRDGTRTQTDFVTRDKSVVETKTGGARLTPNQRKLHDDINAGREVTPVGRNAEKAGLRPGRPTLMKKCSVDRPC